MARRVKKAPAAPIKLDLGCGPNKREGFIGVDSIKFLSVDVVADLRGEWPWEDGSVAEAVCSHTLEHFEAMDRVHFANELYRVLVPGGTCQIITPHWASNRAYGDMSHCWPPVSEMWYFYLKADWRMANAPHLDAKHNPRGYRCDFNATWGYSLNPQILTRNVEYQQHAINFYKEAAQDMIATVTKV